MQMIIALSRGGGGIPGGVLRVRTLLSSSNSTTFHDFLHDLFKFSKNMGSAVSFKNSKTFPCF